MQTFCEVAVCQMQTDPKKLLAAIRLPFTFAATGTGNFVVSLPRLGSGIAAQPTPDGQDDGSTKEKKVNALLTTQLVPLLAPQDPLPPALAPAIRPAQAQPLPLA